MTWNLCKYQFADGRYCANPVAPDYKAKGFCRSHGNLEKFRNRPADEINEPLFLDLFEHNPPTEAEVQAALAVVFRSLAIGKISTRRAGTLGYLGQLLLLKTSVRESRETLSMSTVITQILNDFSSHPKSEAARPASAPPSESIPAPDSALPAASTHPLPAPTSLPSTIPAKPKPTFARVSRPTRKSTPPKSLNHRAT
jgi:hypothetical protein